MYRWIMVNTVLYNIARALVLPNSYWAIEVKISLYARPCVNNMPCVILAARFPLSLAASSFC